VINACVLTISDRGAKGQRTDESGPAVKALLEGINAQVLRQEIIPDEMETIRDKLVEYSGMFDLIVTSGGTGLAPRDVTPEATLAVIDREIPGMAEAMRSYGLRKTPRAMLSRAVVGVRGRCLIINLPGSPRAAVESLGAVIEVVPHAVEKIKGSEEDCAR